MLELSASEAVLFLVAVAAHVAGGVVAVLQLARREGGPRRLMLPVVIACVLSDGAFLAARAVAIKAVPLTGLFESLVALALVFGVLYLIVRSVVDQVWFGSVVAWTKWACACSGPSWRRSSRPRTTTRSR